MYRIVFFKIPVRKENDYYIVSIYGGKKSPEQG